MSNVYKPCRDLLKVEKIVEEEVKKVGSVLIPVDYNKTHTSLARGTVKMVGPGYTNVNGVFITSVYKKGQVVVFKDHPNLDKVMDDDGKQFTLIPSAEIVAVYGEPESED